MLAGMSKKALEFSLPRRISKDDIAGLAPMLQKQLTRAAAKSFRGMTLDEAMDNIARDDMYWEHFRVTRGAEPIYDAWLVSGDCGRLFEADTVTDTRIFMVQSTFKASKGSAHADRLPEIAEAYVEMIRRKRR